MGFIVKSSSGLAGRVALLALLIFAGLIAASCGEKAEEVPKELINTGPAVDANGEPIPDMPPPGPKKGGG